MKYNFLKPEYEVNLVRLGSRFDGGYLIPSELINKTEKLISFGLNDDWSFEEEFKKKNKKLKVLSFDHTVNRAFWYKYTLISFFYFLKNLKDFSKIFKFIAYKFFFQKKLNNFHIKKRIVKKKNNKNEISIDEITRLNEEKVFLKMDIENDEYRILNSIKNFKQIVGFVIEFHYFDLNFRILKQFLQKNKFYKIVHIHANNMGGLAPDDNPTTLEITFINLKFCKKFKKKIIKNFKKNKLDAPNDPYRKDININLLKNS